MKSILVLLAALFLTLSAHAGIAGNWKGYGNWKFKGEGDGVDCSMQMRWSETEHSVTIEKGYYNCDIVVMHTDKATWKLIDGKLFDKDAKEVGKYDGSWFEVIQPSGYENTNIEIKLRVKGKTYDYQEVWYDGTQLLYLIRGRLNK
jgi:hypothetical protein